MSTYRDKATLGVFAKLAADEYLGKNQSSLNETLTKIATQEHLSPHQIEFVAAEANKAVWAKLFAMDKTASYDFPLADSKKIIQGLQQTTAPAQVSGADLDYLSPPTSTKSESFDLLAAMGIQKQALDNSATARREIKRELQSRFEKMAMAKEEIERKIMVNETVISNLELEFVKTARTMVLEKPFEERGQAMEKIAEFVGSCGSRDHGRELMKKLAHVLKRQGLMKEADLKAPEQYISDKLPARVINGNHSLYITIKTLYDRYDDRGPLSQKYEIVDSSLPVVKEKIRAL